MANARSNELRHAANQILEEMLNDLVLSTVMSAHREIKRGRAVCGTCGTKCRAHLPLISFASSSASASSSSLVIPNPTQNPNNSSTSRAPSPQPSLNEGGRSNGYLVGPEKGTGGSTGIGSGSGRMENGNVYFDCLVCRRAMVSNRYAPHLASCLGLNGSTRRGAARNAAAKARLGNNDRSSPSPYTYAAAAPSSSNGANANVGGSDNGDYWSDGDSVAGSKKGKKNLNGNGKRGRSPGKVPLSKKTKLASGSGSATPTSQYQRQALPPSKLGRPPTRPVPTSPVSSPEKSVISIASSEGTGTGMSMGMVGAKTLPGMSSTGLGVTAGEVLPVDPGDDSSEGADDDY